jgi:hypothetical protein
MATFIRGALVVVGVLLMLAGIGLIVGLPGDATFPGLQLVVLGAFLVVVVALERQRYRSDAAERSNAQPGPGGGEPTGVGVDPRFRTTTEVFIDPTSGRRMRVLVDPANGERRYIAEG